MKQQHGGGRKKHKSENVYVVLGSCTGWGKNVYASSLVKFSTLLTCQLQFWYSAQIILQFDQKLSEIRKAA